MQVHNLAAVYQCNTTLPIVFLWGGGKIPPKALFWEFHIFIRIDKSGIFSSAYNIACSRGLLIQCKIYNIWLHPLQGLSIPFNHISQHSCCTVKLKIYLKYFLVIFKYHFEYSDYIYGYKNVHRHHKETNCYHCIASL